MNKTLFQPLIFNFKNIIELKDYEIQKIFFEQGLIIIKSIKTLRCHGIL